MVSCTPPVGKMSLIDFGACREYRKDFVDDYLRLVWSAANRDETEIMRVSDNHDRLRFFAATNVITILDSCHALMFSCCSGAIASSFVTVVAPAAKGGACCHKEHYGECYLSQRSM